MLDDARREMLREMGIPMWVLRAPPGQRIGQSSGAAAGVAGSSPRSAQDAPAEPADPAAAARAALRGDLRNHQGPVTSDVPPRRPPQGDPAAVVAPSRGTPPPTTGRAAEDSEQFEVVSVALPGVVLLLDAAGSKRDMRLARDLVSAAAREWVRKPSRRRFAWPPDARIAPDPGREDAPPARETASRRALRAFVDKDLHDHQAELLLYVGNVSQWLSGNWPGVRVIRVPSLAALSRDPAAKRQLWGELCAPAR